MTITAQIIADSISPQGIRLTTMQLRYPRFIHAEELTHRILETQPELIVYEAIPDGLMYDQGLSRNASSSRAIPIKRMIEDIKRDPVIPVHFGKHQPGMQARKEHDAMVDVSKMIGFPYPFMLTNEKAWLFGLTHMTTLAEAFAEAGYHKQFVNRLLEPWMHINVVVTATDYANFFALRRHEDAQPEIKTLADAMWDAMQSSAPSKLIPGDWHLPYIMEQDYDEALTASDETLETDPDGIGKLIKVSVARCARVSYLTHEGKRSTVEEDLALYDRIIGHTPMHASPAEHQATPDTQARYDLIRVEKTKEYVINSGSRWDNPDMHGNLRGWRQYRKMLPNECVEG